MEVKLEEVTPAARELFDDMCIHVISEQYERTGIAIEVNDGHATTLIA